MAEKSQDPPAFQWIMDNMESLAIEHAGRWVISDENGLFAIGTNLLQLLTSLSDKPPENFAAIYFAPLPPSQPRGGGHGFEWPNMPGGPGATEVSGQHQLTNAAES